MTYETRYFYVPRYEYANRNQHGDRYKRKESKKVNVAKISCGHKSATEMSDLIALGHTLNAPVHYDFKNHRAYLKLMSHDAVLEASGD